MLTQCEYFPLWKILLGPRIFLSSIPLRRLEDVHLVSGSSETVEYFQFFHVISHIISPERSSHYYIQPEISERQ